ncbi:MAG: DMT family transporter [Pelistega sp.]|nr:DMT family transporter [Pelistega sp.]
MISLCVGTSFAKSLFTELGAQGTTSYRLLFSAILLWIIWRPWRFGFNPRYIPQLLYYGISLGLINFLFYMSIRHIPLGLAIAIEFLGPLGLALISSRQRSDFVWIGLVLVGMYLLLGIDDGVENLDPVGVLYAAGAAIFWALYIVAGQGVRHIHPGQATTYGITIAALMTLPFSIGHIGLDGLWRPDLFLFGLTVGVLSSALPYSLEMISLRTLHRKTFGVLLSLEPAFGAIAGAIILHEMLSLRQVLAIICIVIASMGCTLTAKKKLIDKD